MTGRKENSASHLIKPLKVDAPRLIKMPSGKAARREDPEAYAGRVR
jgi:hypothetical protein